MNKSVGITDYKPNIPCDKKRQRLEFCAVHIHRGKIHKKLVYALDETNAMFSA